MRNREVQEDLADQYTSGSEDEYYMNKRLSTVSAGGQGGPSQQAFNEKTRRRRSAQRRRYSDMVSSGDDGDDYDDDMEFGRATTESHKRAKRRQANRECARRIRQKKLDLLNSLTLTYEELQRKNSQMLLDLGAITGQWHQISRENCELQAELAMAKAIKTCERKGSSNTVMENFGLMTAVEALKANNNVGLQGEHELAVLVAV